MAEHSIPKFFPECDLIQILKDKAEQRNDIRFDFMGILNEFRERVAGEVRQINLLFPEYTPHDEEYHLSRLFHVASLVLGRNRLDGMNSAELFLLAVSLYGHDWGMAISEVEKDFILGGKNIKNTHNFSVLPDEEHRLAMFLKKQGFKSGNKDNLDFPNELWREYVRVTHADRSGERVRKYFENINGGIADAAARVCVGHWLNFEDLEDFHLYPQDFSVLRESVNLRALAVYLRLIDLLDLSEDRTPYVIWKFVAPRDPKSKLEWAKHRALHPITCPSYQQGRIIQVDGSTDDNEVFAALEDLRIWCDAQLRGCNDILARMNDDRHKLDLYHIDWRVGARSFKPVLVQFEFDRERMFEILGDEIYQGDPYVFLRELLQNSVDAIRVRREILKRKGMTSEAIGLIKVYVEHHEGCDAIINWVDDGVGMDEFVLRNYFAVAGKSYYRSADFDREGLNIDPVSRFGIGFLSCFMVADRVEVETYREPYLPPPSEPLRITIPAVKRQFRIETFPRENADVGTKIRVYVLGNKLPKNETSNLPHPLDVTSYLSSIAGFVEFPIVIHEGDKKTLILHPNENPQPLLERLGDDYQIQQIDLSFPWHDAILAQDLHLAEEKLESIEFDLSTDLDLQGYEGRLTYLIPKNKSEIFELKSEIRPEVNSKEGGCILIGGKEIRWDESWKTSYGFGGPLYENATLSGHRRRAYSVYRDGILVSEADSPHYRSWKYYLHLPTPKLIANLPKSSTSKINIARTDLLYEKDETWYKHILESHFNQVIRGTLDNLLSKSELSRLYELAYLITFHHNSPKDLWKAFPHNSIPIPFLSKNPILKTINWEKLVNKSVYTLIMPPLYLRKELTNLVSNALLQKNEYQGFLKEWIGKTVYFTIGKSNFIVLDAMCRISTYALGQSHRLDRIDFLNPVSNKFPPIIQGVLTPVKIPIEILDLDIAELSRVVQSYTSISNQKNIDLVKDVFAKAYKDPSTLSNIELGLINQLKESEVDSDFVRFQNPYAIYFGFGKTFLNINHDLGNAILQVYAWIVSERLNKSISTDKVGSIQDKLYKVVNSDEVYLGGLLSIKGYKQLNKALENLWVSVKDLGLREINLDSIMKSPTPSIEEFIPKTIFDPDNLPWATYRGERRIKVAPPFGSLLR
jgi:hypothetical protein